MNVTLVWQRTPWAAICPFDDQRAAIFRPYGPTEALPNLFEFLAALPKILHLQICL